jgi:hypothetical protein
LGFFRFLRDCVVADDWKVMLTEIKSTEEGINKDLGTFGSNTLKGIDDKVSELQNQAQKLLDALMETRARVEARLLLTHGMFPMLTSPRPLSRTNA